ncbi:hypothetical protein NP233_g7994 [Leucocoprinus birnbaumii]|uniref:Uncharacterized protein n=1 Tax=Leucocoprinus birnbaumii TaxID=56174 RepID=A0AAD5VNV4_9AGAR|nr:hypothetical protein NP233_g7994 [Leucocoprinus birnbaumii]
MLIQTNQLQAISELEGLQYRRLIRILIESDCANSAWSVGVIVSYAIQQPLVYTIFIQSSINVKIITLLLTLNRTTSPRSAPDWPGPPPSAQVHQFSPVLPVEPQEPQDIDLQDLSQPPGPEASSSPPKDFQVKK